MNQEIRRALKLPDVEKRLVEGGNVAQFSTPQEFRDLVAREIERWTKVIAAAGIRAGMSAMTFADQHACADVIVSWGLFRDQRRWPELLATFHPDGEIAVSWFRGPFAEFVEHCKRGGLSKHLIMAPLVRVEWRRAPRPRPASSSSCGRPSTTFPST